MSSGADLAGPSCSGKGELCNGGRGLSHGCGGRRWVSCFFLQGSWLVACLRVMMYCNS